MKPVLKLTWKTELVPIAVIIIALLFSFYFYAQMPVKVPTHWNLAGQANGWSSRGFGAFFLPCLLIGIYGLFLFLPNLDPRRDHYPDFAKAYHNFKALIMITLLAIYLGASFTAIGVPVPIEYYVPYFTGVLFFMLGYQLKDIKPNHFIGIRTPWTLESDYVWEKTHQVGGVLFMIAGVLMAITGWLPLAWRGPVFGLVMIGLLAGTMLYSYFIYGQERKGKIKK
jgi:uncharacterized membrane protein